MASPTPYSLAYDFTSFQAASPATPLPADKLEIEFNALETTTDEIITNLNLIQRSDGDLANGVVTFDALSSTVQALLGSSINPLGAWVTATAYEQLDLIEEAGSSYICAVDHTSGVFATDYAAGKWVIWAGSGGSGGSVTVNNSNWSGTDLAVVNGGTGASDAATARTNLGVGTGDSPQFTALNVGDASDTTITRVSAGVIAVEGSNVVLASSIGVSVQAYDATLTALAGVLTAANKIPYATALNTASELDFLDEDAMTSNSATAVPSQQSVKAYVDNNDVVVQRVYTSVATMSSSATIQIPLDDTIPQKTEGLEAITLAITPTSATNRLRIRAIVNGASSGSNQTHIAALFQDSTANALQVAAGFEAIGNNVISIPLQYEMVSGTTSATTFKIRMGSDSSSTYTLNGASAARLFGGVMAHTMVIEEILA